VSETQGPALSGPLVLPHRWWSASGSSPEVGTRPGAAWPSTEERGQRMAQEHEGYGVGNTDDSKRGRDIPPGGRPGKGTGKSPASGGGKGRSTDDPDTEGYGVGGRGKK